MFSCFSKYKYTYIDNPTLRPFKPQFDALLLTPEEVGKLYEIFRSADVDASGHITVQELFAHLATEATFFRDRVFNLFDEDGSGKIDFREFVLSLWNYCTLSKASLVIFAFDLYDVDSTGQLSPKEIHNMLVDLYGKTVDTHPQAKLMNKELKAIDSVVAINVDRFRAFVTNHPALLFPAFQMQLALRQHILGVQFWNRCAEKRLMLVDGRRVALGDLSELNIHESAYLEVLDASFSFDGVIGAFAVTTDPIIIAIGLGVGAFYVRSITIYLVHQGTLSDYRYLDHGAHWAIGALAALLMISIGVHVPEIITGLIGVAFIGAAFYMSLRANKLDAENGEVAADEGRDEILAP